MHTHTYIQRTSRVATSVLSGRLVLAKVQADQKKRIITGSEYSSPPPSQTRFCRKATPLACKRNTLDKKTSLNISFGTRGSIISMLTHKFFVGRHVYNCHLAMFRNVNSVPDVSNLLKLSTPILLEVSLSTMGTVFVGFHLRLRQHIIYFH